MATAITSSSSGDLMNESNGVGCLSSCPIDARRATPASEAATLAFTSGWELLEESGDSSGSGSDADDDRVGNTRALVNAVDVPRIFALRVARLYRGKGSARGTFIPTPVGSAFALDGMKPPVQGLD